jgi:hypothetical protein
MFLMGGLKEFYYIVRLAIFLDLLLFRMTLKRFCFLPFLRGCIFGLDKMNAGYEFSKSRAARRCFLLCFFVLGSVSFLREGWSITAIVLLLSTPHVVNAVMQIWTLLVMFCLI